MSSNIELNFDDFSDERRYKNQEVGSSLVSQNSGLKKRKILDHSEGTLATLSQKICPFSLRSQLSKGEVLEFEKAKPMTNDQILDFIEKEVALLKSAPRRKDDIEWQRFSPVHNEQCTTAPGQEDDSIPLLPFELSSRSKGKCDMSASEKCLTDDQHVMLEVAASCITNEAESPVTVTEREDISLKPVEGVGLGRVHSMIDGNQDANANTQKNTEDQQYYHVESKEIAELSCLASLTDKIEINNMRSVTVNQSEQSVCSQTSSKNMEEDATGVYLQADLSISLPVNKKITPPCRPEGEATTVAVLNAPQYEDISDDEDLPRLDMNLLNTKQEGKGFADPSYEDISEDENLQFQNIAEEMPSPPCEVSEGSAMQYEPVQNQAKINPSLTEELIPKEQMSSKTETLDPAQHCSCPCFVESEDGFERVLCPKCDSEKHLKWQTSHSFRPLFVTQHQGETEEAADEDSEWLVIPVNVTDVNWEPAGEGQADGENSSQSDGEHENQVKQSDTNAAVCEVPNSVPNRVPAAAFPPMEVFDTFCQQVKAIQSRETTLQSPLVPSSWGIAETKAHRPQNRESHCDPEDSCETEDSSDYSSDSEHNYLTVSTQFVKSLSVPASPETVDSDSEKENEDHEMPNLQQCQTRDRRKSSGNDDIINLDSDTEDEGFQNCAETKTKRLFSMRTQNSGATCLNQLKKLSPETVDGQCGTVKEPLNTNRLRSADSPASHCQSRCYQEVIQTRNAQLSQRTEKYGHLLENKTGSHHLKKEVPKQIVSDDPSVIVIFDSDDEGKQSNRQEKRKGILASESMSAGSTSCGQQRRDNEKKESAKPNDREPSVSSADSSKSQHQSQLQHVQLKEKRPDERPSHGTKKRKLIKVRVHPDHVHQKPERQTTSNTVERDTANLMKNKTNIVSSETEDSDDASVDAQSSHCASKKKQISLSGTDSSKKLPQSVDKDVDSTKTHHEHFQQKAKIEMASKTVEREVEKDLKLKRKTRVLSSEPGDTYDTLIYAQSSQSVVDSIKVCREHVQRKTHGHMTSEKMGRELKKGLIKHKRKTRVLTSMHSSSSSKECLSSTKRQRSDAYSNSSTLNQSCAPTKGPSSSISMPSSAKEQVFHDWQNSFVPTRRDRKASLRNSCDSLREARPGPSHHGKAHRQRHRSYESLPALGKRCKNEAIQMTKDRKQDAQWKQGFPVSQGYKCKNQADFMANKRPGKRFSSPPRPHH
ncbi:uncharacterized protein LOC115773612 [Archocentrus centrarchus]|uniref:uncharacterized protein LOC115773612 n=1 Tax=Archocentrus centrarchus TaxID=63155 RepID=UPI0011EA0CEB|nr:uncharacterized protein LOC115773612 [Archocentrus centrarchus]XP_030576305.1 uncharacterized protein LOC115773612 [Archocentrus centrarchus]XP_030576307.1 uncharacterized protein LOC115773612 [Archocentrus centrarchus]XP_030576308.1 uncharacterized protein LOC115773612 [Archocentrus centrarchus]